jgi:RNA recognition motif-containing protein
MVSISIIHELGKVHKGSAYIHYEKRQDVEAALESMNNGQIDGNVVSCAIAATKPSPPPRSNRRDRSKSPYYRREGRMVDSYRGRARSRSYSRGRRRSRSYSTSSYSSRSSRSYSYSSYSSQSRSRSPSRGRRRSVTPPRRRR